MVGYEQAEPDLVLQYKVCVYSSCLHTILNNNKQNLQTSIKNLFIIEWKIGHIKLPLVILAPGQIKSQVFTPFSGRPLLLFLSASAVDKHDKPEYRIDLHVDNQTPFLSFWSFDVFYFWRNIYTQSDPQATSKQFKSLLIFCYIK